MKQIVIASRNVAKVQAVIDGYTLMFPEEEVEYVPIHVDSEVADQPMGEAETYLGAMNRLNSAQALYSEADMWFGMEGGLIEEEGEMSCFAWVLVKSKDQFGKAKTGSFYLPKITVELIQEGYELAHADDKIFALEDSKNGGGTIGILTEGALNRSTYYEQAVIMSLIPFKKQELF